MLHKEASPELSGYELTQIGDSRRRKISDRILCESLTASRVPPRGYRACASSETARLRLRSKAVPKLCESGSGSY